MKDILKDSNQVDVRAKAFLEMGILKYNNKEYKEALTNIENVLSWRADDVEGLMVKGKAEYMLGNKKVAKRAFRKVLKQKHDDKEALSWLKR